MKLENLKELENKEMKECIEDFLELNPIAEISQINVFHNEAEWNCEHKVGHPIYARNGDYVHGCDNCCDKLDFSYLNKKE